MAPHKFYVFRRLLLGNTFKELVAWDRETLERWQCDPQCRNRIEALSNRFGECRQPSE